MLGYAARAGGIWRHEVEQCEFGDSIRTMEIPERHPTHAAPPVCMTGIVIQAHVLKVDDRALSFVRASAACSGSWPRPTSTASVSANNVKTSVYSAFFNGCTPRPGNPRELQGEGSTNRRVFPCVATRAAG